MRLAKTYGELQDSNGRRRDGPAQRAAPATMTDEISDALPSKAAALFLCFEYL
jgi:hypothetical protein